MVLRGDREVDPVRVAVLGVGEDEHEDEVLALVVRPAGPDRLAILGLELVGARLDDDQLKRLIAWRVLV